MTNEPLGYSIPDACQHLGDVSRAHVYRMVNKGKLELVKIGGRSIITTRSMNALLPQTAEAA